MKKSNSKKIVIGLFTVVGALVLFLIIANILQSNNNDTGQIQTGPDYEVEPDELPYIGNSEMYEILNDRSGEGIFVYIGRPTCPACRQYEPVLRELLQEMDRQLLYFQIDAAHLADAVSEMTTNEIIEAVGVRYVPSIAFIRNGEVIEILTGAPLLGLEAREITIEFFEEHGGLN